jgi:hypothetical protein
MLFSFLFSLPRDWDDERLMIAHAQTASCAPSCDTLRNPNESHAALTRSFGRLPLREQNAKLCRTSGSPVNKLSGAMTYPRTRRPGTEYSELSLGRTIFLLYRLPRNAQMETHLRQSTGYHQYLLR